MILVRPKMWLDAMFLSPAPTWLFKCWNSHAGQRYHQASFGPQCHVKRQTHKWGGKAFCKPSQLTYNKCNVLCTCQKISRDMQSKLDQLQCDLNRIARSGLEILSGWGDSKQKTGDPTSTTFSKSVFKIATYQLCFTTADWYLCTQLFRFPPIFTLTQGEISDSCPICQSFPLSVHIPQLQMQEKLF